MRTASSSSSCPVSSPSRMAMRARVHGAESSDCNRAQNCFDLVSSPRSSGETGASSSGSDVRSGRQGVSGRHSCCLGYEPRDRGRRVHGSRRAVGVRQDDGASDGRRARGDQRGRPAHRRPRREPRALSRPRHRDGLPELRALSASLGLRQHRLRAQASQGEEGRDRHARAGGGAHPRARAVPEAEAARALRRSAPARRHGARDRAAPAGFPHGRAALEPRREAARADARGDRAHPGRPRRHDASTSRTTRSRR